jgi:predicted CoA-binding protein
VKHETNPLRERGGAMRKPKTSIDELARGFLSQRRIAVAGVSRDGKQAANLIFRKLRETGHDVVAVNPRATQVEGAACYERLSSVPEPVDAVVIATPPAAADAVVDECVALGVRWVWMHRAFGAGSVSEAAVAKCREHGIRVIAGACPMMYCEPVDTGHRCMRWILRVSGRMPATESPKRPRR